MLRMALIICCSFMLMGCSATLEEWGWINNDLDTESIAFRNATESCSIKRAQTTRLSYARWKSHNNDMRRYAIVTGNRQPPLRDKKLSNNYVPTMQNYNYAIGSRDFFAPDQNKRFEYCMLDKGWRYEKVNVARSEEIRFF